jgi:hypothetical protein
MMIAASEEAIRRSPVAIGWAGDDTGVDMRPGVIDDRPGRELRDIVGEAEIVGEPRSVG